MVKRILLAITLYALLWAAIIIAALWNVYITAGIVTLAISWIGYEIHRAPIINGDEDEN